MISTETFDKVISSNHTNTKIAQIEMTPVMYELLSSDIYENKILAIIRELLCNASDAQADIIGGENNPIDLYLPSTLDPTFYIRDYGTGLSEESIMDVYMAFGRSTKGHSNDYVGMLGIGAKSPLSYTDSFIVISYHGGYETTYNLYKKDGYPTISKINEVLSQEHTGLKIILPVENKDKDNFCDEAKKFLITFDKPVNVINSKDVKEFYENRESILIKKEKYWIVNSQLLGGSVYVLMGGVPYEIPSDKERLLRNELKIPYSRSVIIPVPMGSVSFAPSRERLSFKNGDKTCTFLTKVVEEIILSFFKDVSETISEEPNFREACKSFSDNFGIKLGGWQSSTEKIKYKDVLISDIELKINKEVKDCLEKEENNSYYIYGKKVKFTVHNTKILLREYNKELILVNMDLKRGSVKTLKQLSRLDGKIYVTSCGPDLEKIIKEYTGGFSEKLNCSEEYERLFPSSERNKNLKEKSYRKLSGVFECSIKDNYHYKNEIVHFDDVKKESYYLDMVRNEAYFVDENGEKSEELVRQYDINLLMELGLFSELYLLRRTLSKKKKEELKTKLIPLTKEKINSMIKDRFLNSAIKKEILDYYSERYLTDSLGYLNRSKEKLSDIICKDKYEYVKYLLTSYKKENVNKDVKHFSYLKHLRFLTSDTRKEENIIDEDLKVISSEIQDDICKIKDEFPVLKEIRNVSGIGIDQVLELIKISLK